MKKRRLIILLFALLLPARMTFAAEDAPADPDAGLRMAVRLGDLGYLTSPANLASEETLAAALGAFCETNGVSGLDRPDELFSRDAKPAPFPGGGIPLPKTPLSTGSAVPYEQIRERLLPGETYAVTDCGTAVVCYLTCETVGAHAILSPSRDWDASALSGLLGENDPFAKRPVTLTLGGESVAAVLEPASGGEGAVRYGLYFVGGAAGLNGVEDADRANLLTYAAGGDSGRQESRPAANP